MATSNAPSSTSSAKPEPGRRERKRQQTLDLLAATAFRLFEAQGYDNVTMEQIAKEADVAKGTLYNHFPAKEALLVHHFHGELAAAGPQLQAAIQAYPDFAGRMRCLLHASADWSAAHRTYLGPYLRFRLSTYDFAPAGNLYSRSGLDRVFEALIRAGQQAGELRSYSTPAKLARQFQFLYLGALMSWLSQEDCDLHLEFDAALDVFLHGLMVTTTKGTK